MNMTSKNNIVMVLDYALGSLLIFTFLLFYWPTLTKLTNQLVSDENYSFGLLLPLVSAYIIYLKLPQLRNIVWQRSWLGLLIIAKPKPPNRLASLECALVAGFGSISERFLLWCSRDLSALL
jgi:hypothetical protein